jgi:rubrerythrin
MVKRNIDNAATENYGKIVSKRNETDDASTYRLQLTDDPDKLLSLELNGVSSDDCIIAKDTWVYITASYNGSVRYIFINGTQVYSGALSGPLWGSSKNVYIGVRKKESSAPDYKFGGILDEVRLSKAARSGSWIITEFNNQNDTSTFYSVGSEEFLSGDNYDEVIIGAYGYGNDQGRAYIFFGGSEFTGEISAGNASVIINGTAPNDRLGWDVSRADDVNNDGFGDVIVGAPGNNGDTGAVYIFLGDNNIPSLINDTDADVSIFGGSSGDEFGFSLSFADDVNNDGFDDVIIGAPGNNSDCGVVYIFFGNSSINSLINVADANMIMLGESIGDKFGFSVHHAGDVNGDGVSDVIVGAPYHDNGAKTYAGAVYVFEGGASMDNIIDWSFKGEQTNDHLGWSVSFAGNLCGDGLTYLIVGAPNNDDGGVDAGKAYLLTIMPNKPLITNILATPSIQNIGGYVNITCDVTALSGVDEVWVNITLPGGGYNNVSMTQGVGNQWFYNNNYSIPGLYQYTIWAKDTLGNWTKSDVFQFQVINSPPLLSSPQVDPLTGYTDTGFNFTVVYTDLDNHAPNNITVNITSIGVYDLIEVDPSDTNYADGKEYYYNTSGFSVNLYSFHFAANDTLGDWDETVEIPGLQIFNTPPILLSPDVDPLSGTSTTYFNFTVNYIDLDDHSPGNITLNLSGPSGGTFDLIEVDPLDTIYSDGKEYYYNTTLSNGSYSFHFAANDSYGNWYETAELSVPLVGISKPIFTESVVKPNSGYVDTWFNFTVNYSHPFDKGPDNITLNLTGPSGGIFDLIEVDPLDTNYTNGKLYYYNISGLAVGSYSFNFAANDTDGNWSESGIKGFEVLNRVPILALDQVNPITGFTDTGFNFTVNYMDLDNHAPDNLTLNITGVGVYDLIEVDPLDTDYRDGKAYYYNVSGFAVGSYSFHFAANDTIGNWTESGILQFDVLNREPMLSLGQVDPISGYIDTWFNFTVMYTDPENHPPDIISVNITGVGIYDLNELDNLDIDYTDGKAYYYNLSGFAIGSYTFHFAANDTIGNWTETSILQFDVFNRAPILTLEQVNPTSGYIDTYFNFTVNYINLDNNAPFIIIVNITGVGVYDLMEVDPLDTNYMDGKDYYYNISGFAVGLYSFHFAANDTFGNWTESIVLQFEVINRLPTLSFGQVNPITGYIDTAFNFTIVYTDLDDHAPDKITLNISAVGIYDLIEADSFDIDYTDGKEYYLNLSGFTLGQYSFHFAANDTLGNWVETGILQFDVINRVPDLSLAQVNPSVGDIDSTFNFTVFYTDLDNQPPDIITVNITGIGVYDLFALDPLDMDYTDGKAYYYNTSGFSISSYSFLFAANDTQGDWIETLILNFDVIDRVPTLLFEQVNPITGYTDTWFNFTVTYADLDNHATNGITVNITGIGVYNLFPQDTMDMDYSDGKDYYYSLSGFAVGQYSLHFAANDILGNWVETGILQFDVLNRAPLLSLEQVNPTIGYTDTWFNFTITYTDLDDHAPFNITLNLSGPSGGIFGLVEVDPSDTDYMGGKEYYYNTTLTSGLYSFHFAAIDLLGMWALETTEINSPDVIPKQGYLEAIDYTAEFSDEIYLNATLFDNVNNPISDENVAFYIDENKNGIYEAGEFVGAGTTLADGNVSVIYSIHIVPGIYNFKAIYIGSGDYVFNDDEALLIIYAKGATLTAISDIVEEDEVVSLTAILINIHSNPIPFEQVEFFIDKNKDGIYYPSESIGSGTTSAGGVALITYTVNLAPENYGIWAKYVGSANYTVNEIEGVLTVQNIGNRPPSILGKVPDQSKPEDSLPWPLDLTSYEGDIEDSGPDLKWYLTGIDTTLYSVTGMNSSDDIFTFIPVPDAFGNDEVILWLWDSSGDRVSQVLWVNITPENDLPYFNPLPPNLFVHYDDPNTNDDDPIPWDYTFYVHDIETANEDLIITTSEPTVDAGRGYAEVDGLKVTFYYPQDRAGESIAVFLTLSDGIDVAQTMIWVNVTSDWVPELVGKLPDIVLEENTTLYNVFDLDDYFIDKDHDSLYFSSGYFHIKVNINENNTVDITAIGHWTGSELVTFRAWDPIGAIAEDTITVTVIPVNNPPVISGVPNLVVHYDYYYAFDLSPYIFDLDNHTYELIVWTSEPTNYIWLQQQNNLGIVVNYPEAMEGMTIPVTIYVSDGIEIASQQILINVTSNFPPELIHNLPDVFFDEDTVLRNAFHLSDYFIDIDSNVLFYTNGTKFINATINENLTVDFSAPENWYGFEIVTFRATDPMGALAEDKILVVVVPVNDAPTIKSMPTQEKEEGDEWLLDLSQYIDDVDNNASELIITVQSEAGQGYVTLVGTILMFQYPEGVREDIITITVSDGELEASRSFIVNIKSSRRVAPSIWDLIPWPWVFLFLVAGTGGAFAFYKKKSRYWVYEAFLIHEDGLPIAHASEEESSGLEDVVVSGMFTAVQNFINDTFSEQTSEDDWELDEMKFGDHKILIERSQYLYLAVIFEGYGSKLCRRVKKLLIEINDEYGTVFEDWDGDMTKLEDIKAMIASLIIKKGRRLGSKDLRSQPQAEARGEEFEEALMDWEGTNKVGVEELEEFLEDVEKTFPGIVGADEVEVEEIEVLVCPVCGKEIEAKVNKCPRCGVEFTEIEEVLPSSSLKPENEESKK